MRFQNTARVRAPRGKPMPCWQKGEDSPESACRAGGLPHGRLGPFFHTPCAMDAGYVHALAAGFPKFRLNAYIGLDKSRGHVTQVVRDTGAGPNLVREDFLPKGWEQHGRPLSVRFVIIDANGRRIPPTSAIVLVIRMGKTQMPATSSQSNTWQ